MLFICNTEITGVCQGLDEGGLAHTARAHDRDQLVHGRNYKMIRQLPDYLMDDRSTTKSGRILEDYRCDEPAAIHLLNGDGLWKQGGFAALHQLTI
jgi:hypothetical protein